MYEITHEVAQKVLDTVDAGLVAGVGNPVLGQMCVEAAVCYAMGLPHSDDPPCVNRTLRSLKITLNDSNWSSPQARAKGLRELALVQLGSRDELDDMEFAKRVVLLVINKYLSPVLRENGMDAEAVACENADTLYKARTIARNSMYGGFAFHFFRGAVKCASTRAIRPHIRIARSIDTVTYAVMVIAHAFDTVTSLDYTTYNLDMLSPVLFRDSRDSRVDRDMILSSFAKDVVEILTEMKVPGVQWLELINN